MAAIKAKGIDVSKYQGSIDFKKVKADGYDYVIIRAGYGKMISQKDPMFETNYSRAKAAGLGIGAYWYSYATSAAEARQEANVCMQVIQGKQFAYPIFFDLEDPSAFAKGKAVCSEMVNAFCRELEEAEYFAGLYISRNPLQTHITDTVAKRYALWIAEYNSKCTYSGSYGMWQHSSKGSVSGVDGNVDLNECYVDYPAIIKRNGLNGFAKAASTAAVPKPETPDRAKISYAKGAKITLSQATLYASATAANGSKKSGTFYIYDGQTVNGRMRITNSAANVGKTPVGQYVTGWVKRSEMK